MEQKVEKDPIAQEQNSNLVNIYSVARDVLENHRKGDELTAKDLKMVIIYVLSPEDIYVCPSKYTKYLISIQKEYRTRRQV